jgi:hypothetical protein
LTVCGVIPQRQRSTGLPRRETMSSYCEGVGAHRVAEQVVAPDLERR